MSVFTTKLVFEPPLDWNGTDYKPEFTNSEIYDLFSDFLQQLRHLIEKFEKLHKLIEDGRKKISLSKNGKF